MAQFYLINSIIFAGLRHMPGELVDSNSANTTAMTAAGALLWPASNTTIAAAAAIAQNALKNRGANETELAAIMNAAVEQVQLTNDANNVTSAGTVTLVAGTKTVNTGITITASSVVLTSMNTPGGGGNGVDYKVPSASLVVGGPGVGAFVVTAVDATGATVATDVSTINYLVVN